MTQDRTSRPALHGKAPSSEVIPTRGAVIPAAVGVDIGCGMIAAELDLTEDWLPDALEPLLDRVARAITAGVGQGHREVADAAVAWLAAHAPASELADQPADRAIRQFGTLGSGNDFFELCVDEIPAAYKDIDQVMADQDDLVEVQHTLHQVLNHKGT